MRVHLGHLVYINSFPTMQAHDRVMVFQKLTIIHAFCFFKKFLMVSKELKSFL